MRTLAATFVAAALLTSTVACSSADDATSTPAPTAPAESSTTSTPSTTTPSSTAPSPTTDPPDLDPDGDGFQADDGVLALTTSSRGTSCFTGDNADFGWFDAQWKSHTDLDAVTFRLEGGTGVKIVGSPTTVPPVNFGGRIDYGGLVDWADKSPLADERSIQWVSRDDTDFLAPIEDQSGLLLFHLRFAPDTVAGKQRASLGDLVAAYTRLDQTTGTVTLPIEEFYGFGRNRC